MIHVPPELRGYALLKNAVAYLPQTYRLADDRQAEEVIRLLDISGIIAVMIRNIKGWSSDYKLLELAATSWMSTPADFYARSDYAQ